MHIRHLAILIFSLISFSVSAAVDLSPLSRASIDLTEARQRLSRGDDEAPTYYPMILMVDDEETVDQLRAMGTIIYHRRDELLLASIPVDTLKTALDLPGLFEAQTCIPSSVNMDVARPMTSVDLCHAGTGLPEAYDGKGVLVGLCDIGFDPWHIAFGREVESIYDYDTRHGKRLVINDMLSMARWRTDTPDNFHATHVANILAGRCKEAPYYGVAPGATFAASTSQLYDTGILGGIEDLIALAKSKGIPAIINLSLGSHVGPHDGTDLICRYLERCAKDATICFSAGNSGHWRGYANPHFSEKQPLARLTVNSTRAWTGQQRIENITDIWGEDATPIKARIEIWDNDDKRVVYSTDWSTDTLRVSDVSDPAWAQYFEGNAAVYHEVSKLNGKYNLTYVYSVKATIQSGIGPWTRYLPLICIQGEYGTQAHVYSDATQSQFAHVTGEGACPATTDMSISNLCCAPGVVAVGSCNSRSVTPVLGGTPQTWGFEDNTVSHYSSYGAGLPHFCAPGAYVMSAASTPFVEAHPNAYAIGAQTEANGKTYYWMAECGTSMAAPHAAGVFALWLQANPYLTTADLIEIAQQTANTDFSDFANPRWGAGCINAYEGLKMALKKLNSLVAPEHSLPLVAVTADRRLEITMPECDSRADISLCTLAGRRADHREQLQPGVYVLKIGHYPAQKIVMR